MKHIEIMVALVVFSMSVGLQAQELAPTHVEQKAAMSELKPLLGKWKGRGWIEMGPRRFDFESSEVFAEKAGGMAIMVEGLHWIPMPDGKKRVVHDAVAMINYDADSDRYRFISQLATGRGGDYHGTLTEDGDFQWVIPDTPIGKMTYTISVRGEEYREVGVLTSRSGEAKTFFEMNLKKSAD